MLFALNLAKIIRKRRQYGMLRLIRCSIGRTITNEYVSYSLRTSLSPSPRYQLSIFLEELLLTCLSNRYIEYVHHHLLRPKPLQPTNRFQTDASKKPTAGAWTMKNVPANAKPARATSPRRKRRVSEASAQRCTPKNDMRKRFK